MEGIAQRNVWHQYFSIEPKYYKKCSKMSLRFFTFVNICSKIICLHMIDCGTCHVRTLVVQANKVDDVLLDFFKLAECL